MVIDTENGWGWFWNGCRGLKPTENGWKWLLYDGIHAVDRKWAKSGPGN